MLANRPAHSRVLSLVAALAACLVATSPAQGQTYTSPGGQTFTNIVGWNFAQGPVPFSDPNNLLTIQNFGTTSFTASNDLNLTLQTLQLNAFSTGAITLASLLNGNFVFGVGVAPVSGSIQQVGVGGTSIISAQVVLGSSSTWLTFAGPALSSTTISGFFL